MMQYERQPKNDWGTTFFVIVLVVMAFAIITALTDEPEDQAIEAMGSLISNLIS